MSSILVFCETKSGKLKAVTREAVSAAKKLGADVTAVNIGPEASDAASLGGFGASKVFQVWHSELEHYSTEGYAQAAAEIIKSENPTAVFIPATARGKDLAPRVAARVGAALLSDCTDIKIENNEVHALRPIYAGKVLMWAKVIGALPMLTLRPKAFLAEETGGIATVETRSVNIDASKIRARVIEEKAISGLTLDVTEADIIVSGGRGLRGPENFAMIEELAKVLSAATGASRAVVDAGWRPHAEQVGQTGKVVAPSLYIAIAISGAVQHLAGMGTSRTIVAINKDADAPIFKIATYGIVGDAFEIVPKLTEELKKIKEHG